MNKNAIQKFAIWARNELIAQVSQRAYQYGVTKDGYGEQNAVTVGGRALTTDEQRQRKELVDQIRSKGYTQVMEEVAYTWFNRFIALRFMEVNNYLPSHIRVFSDSTGAFKPEILSDVLHLELPGLSREKVAEYIESNDTEGLYRYLLLTQCNALNAPLPRMFEKMGGYTELLLPNNILKQDSVLGHMVADIPEEDWTDQVQIIGWLYQYYNTELKDDTFAQLKKNVKITKERIPAATQLFTPDWIVRYMVENSLGRLWLEGHPNAELRGGWKYYLDEAEQERPVEDQLAKLREEYKTIKPEDIKVIDPCMGSGHILVYAFDVLMQIYEASGYSQRDAAQSILENNLFGLDIDDRAAQLAYFAVMMKARQYDRRLLTRGIQPHIYAFAESNSINRDQLKFFGWSMGDVERSKAFTQVEYLLDTFRDAKEYGSILSVDMLDWELLYRFAGTVDYSDQISMDELNLETTKDALCNLVELGAVMARKYDVVVTNPPYMGASGMNARLAQHIKDHFPDTKADLFACFIERGFQLANVQGFVSMITMESWMFLSSFEKMRQNIVNTHTIVNMVHMPYLGKGGTSLGINFGTAAVIFNKRYCRDYNSQFDYICYYETDENGVPFAFPTVNERYKAAKATNFSKIPGSPVAYWVSDQFIKTFDKGISIDEISKYTGSQNITANNEKYLRYLWEVADNKVGRDARWVFYIKGGLFRKWYGNIELVVDWSNEAVEFYRTNSTSNLLAEQYRFKQGITYTELTSGVNSFRFLPPIAIFDKKGPCIVEVQHNEYCLAFFNSIVAVQYFKLLNPTITLQVKDVKNTPLIIDMTALDNVTKLATDSIHISRLDWDSSETSWDFKRNPLVNSKYLTATYTAWKQECEDRFRQLKENEEELNRIFIDIYGLQDELTPDVADRDVTVHRVFDSKDDVPESMKGSSYVRTMRDEIVSLISYAMGCMLGRYSLDEPGLVYAGGEWDSSKYSTYMPDTDNIIPICDDDYFDDDITGRFVKWVETVYGKETLEENLKFIADALGGKGTPREIIRSYFLNDFYADHLKAYQKRPIYWLFDSGKKNGFKALIYMHRYQSDLLARMRTDYVHEQQERYRTQLTHLADAIEHAGAAERVKLTKQQKKLQEQALEIQKYEEKIHHLADQNIQIDLDDGVKHNYELFADVLAKIK